MRVFSTTTVQLLSSEHQYGPKESVLVREVSFLQGLFLGKNRCLSLHFMGVLREWFHCIMLMCIYTSYIHVLSVYINNLSANIYMWTHGKHVYSILARDCIIRILLFAVALCRPWLQTVH